VRWGLWALFALLLGAFVAHFVLEDRGYVLINFRSYIVEMSVPGLLLVLVALYLGVRGVVVLVRSPLRVRKAIRERGLRRGGADLAKGLIHITEGDFARAERLLTRGLATTDAPLVNYLLAARAAQLQGAPERRDQWLKLAYDESPDGEVTVLLTQAELQLNASELDAALATLKRLEQLKPDHPGALGLLARTYRARGDGAEREDAGVNAFHRNTEILRGLAIELGSPHDEANSHFLECHPNEEEQKSRRANDNELVSGISEPRKEQPELNRRLDRPGIRAECHERSLLKDVEQSNRRDDGCLRIMLQWPKDEDIAQGRDRTHHDRTEGEGKQEAKRRMVTDKIGAKPRDDCAQHEKSAMGNIDHAHHTKDQRQSQSGQSQDEGLDRSLEQCEQQMWPEAHDEPGEKTSERWKPKIIQRFRAILQKRGTGGAGPPAPI